MNSIHRCLKSILTKKELTKLFLVSVLLAAIAGMEVAGVGLIAFILVNFSDLSSVIVNTSYLSLFHDLSSTLGQSPSKIFSYFLVFYSVITLFLSIYIIKFISFYSQNLGATIKERVTSRFLSMDLEEINTISTSQSMSRIIFDSEQVADSIYFLMHFFSKFFLASLIVLFLLFFNTTLTIIFSGILMSVYIFLFFYFDSLTKINSTISANSKDLLTRSVKNMFGSLKEIFFYDNRIDVLKNISYHNVTYARAKASNGAYAQMPRSIIDSLILLSLISVLLYLESQALHPEMFFSTISVFGIAALRLLPAFQNIFYFAHEINSRTASLDNLYQLNLTDDINLEQKNTNLDYGDKDFQSIEFINVAHQYSSASKFALNNISFKLERGKKIAFFGASGSGKSTFIDILLGLITPLSGDCLIDNSKVPFHSLKEYRNLFSYLPQKIFFLEATLKDNIIFGANKNSINEDVLNEAVQSSSLQSLINQLPDGMETILSDDQQLISGGQKQMVGMARAFARGGKILVLDESTSAMDSILESEMFNSIFNSNFDTFICITHKPELLQYFDCVYFFHEGEIHASGSFNELYNSNNLFKKILASNEHP